MISKWQRLSSMTASSLHCMFSVNPPSATFETFMFKEVFYLSLPIHFTDVQTEAREGEMVIRQFNFTGSSRAHKWRVGSPKVRMA